MAQRKNNKEGREAVKSLVRVTAPGSALSRALVVPPIAAIAGSVQRVVATELAALEQLQASGEGLSFDDARKLQALVTALTGSMAAEKSARADDLDGLSDAQLDAKLAEYASKARLPDGD